MLDERREFIEECKSQEWSMAEVCRRFEISRKTGYKWLARFDKDGTAGLEDRSHAPHSNPRQVSDKVEDAIVAARSKHPHWGPIKLRQWLERTEPGTHWPAASTIGEILRRHGLAVPQKKRRAAFPNAEPLRHATGPNLVWCADFKGWFCCGNGARCNPLTISDAYSRFLLRCQAAKHPAHWYTKPIFEAAFREFGMPKCIRIDNGTPFATTGIGGLSELSVWWIKLGIRPERIEPGKPSQNGRHERMHRTLKQETATPACDDLRAQQKAFDAFRQEYNWERPHAALGGKPPGECYQASDRRYPGRVRTPEYPAEYATRIVDEGGNMKWKSHKVFVGRALTGEPIGLEPSAGSQWKIWFSFYELGVFDEEKLLIRPYRQGSNAPK